MWTFICNISLFSSFETISLHSMSFEPDNRINQHSILPFDVMLTSHSEVEPMSHQRSNSIRYQFQEISWKIAFSDIGQSCYDQKRCLSRLFWLAVFYYHFSYPDQIDEGERLKRHDCFVLSFIFVNSTRALLRLACSPSSFSDLLGIIRWCASAFVIVITLTRHMALLNIMNRVMPGYLLSPSLWGLSSFPRHKNDRKLYFVRLPSSRV